MKAIGFLYCYYIILLMLKLHNFYTRIQYYVKLVNCFISLWQDRKTKMIRWFLLMDTMYYLWTPTILNNKSNFLIYTHQQCSQLFFQLPFFSSTKSHAFTCFWAGHKMECLFLHFSPTYWIHCLTWSAHKKPVVTQPFTVSLYLDSGDMSRWLWSTFLFLSSGLLHCHHRYLLKGVVTIYNIYCLLACFILSEIMNCSLCKMKVYNKEHLSDEEQ